MKDIYLNDWLSAKRYQNAQKSDYYYLGVCKKVLEILRRYQITDVQLEDLSNDDLIYFSTYLVSYFEDVISETNLWSTFVFIHKEKYGKPIPFYSVEDYDEEDLNVSDIRVLIWYYLYHTVGDVILPSFLSENEKMANEIYTVFDEEWDNALVNKQLQKQLFFKKEHQNQFSKVKSFTENIAYSHFPFTVVQLDKVFLETDNHLYSVPNLLEQNSHERIMTNLKDYFTFGLTTDLFSFKPQDWAKSYLNNVYGFDLGEIHSSIMGYFYFRKDEGQYYVFESHFLKKLYKVRKDSFKKNQIDESKNSVYFLNLVNFCCDFVNNGDVLDVPVKSLVTGQIDKSKLELVSLIASLKEEQSEVIKDYQLKRKAFLEANNSSPIIFIESEKLDAFKDDFIETSFSLDKYRLDDESGEILMVYANPISGIEDYPFDISEPSNSKSEDFELEIFIEQFYNFFFNENSTPEFLIFLIKEYYGDEIFEDCEEERIVFKNDLDFFLRVFKAEFYEKNLLSTGTLMEEYFGKIRV